MNKSWEKAPTRSEARKTNFQYFRGKSSCERTEMYFFNRLQIRLHKNWPDDRFSSPTIINASITSSSKLSRSFASACCGHLFPRVHPIFSFDPKGNVPLTADRSPPSVAKIERQMHSQWQGEDRCVRSSSPQNSHPYQQVIFVLLFVFLFSCFFS